MRSKLRRCRIGLLSTLAVLAAWSPAALSAEAGNSDKAFSEEANVEVAARASTEVDMVQAIEALVQGACNVRPSQVLEGRDAYRVQLFLDAGDRRCLDEVVMRYDRDHAASRTLTFDVASTPDRSPLPVMHVSSIEAGPFAHIRLQDGRTLFPGAVVGGWTLEAIAEDGTATLARGAERFELSLDDKILP